jgi:hypothetical protein
MKVTYSISIGVKEDIYITESDIENDLEKYIDVLKPTSITSFHFVLFEMINNKNQQMSIYDNMHNAVVKFCFFAPHNLLKNVTYEYSNYYGPTKIIFEPNGELVTAKYRDEYEPVKDYEVTFNRDALCVELYKCGQRYIDFYNRLPKFEDNGTDYYQELSDKTKTLLEEHDLL